MASEKLREAINARGLKQKYIAEKIGISETTLYRKMSDDGDFSRTEIKKIMTVLDIADPVPIFLQKNLHKTQERRGKWS